jgi:putative N6-adenine-specific DNA methylase
LFGQKKFRIAIKTLQNLEEVLAEELAQLGGEKIEVGNRVVHCTGDQKFLYKANLHLRTALRILVPIAEFPIRDADNIYTQSLKTDWSTYMDVDQTFAIDPNVHSEFIKHSNYASVKLKDAIADFFTKRNGRRPSVHPDHPDVLFNLHIDNHRVTISLDSSGESLNRRGYRSAGAKAPLNEVLAAGMIMLTGWKGKTDFYDPMCGSGTLAIEAAMIAQNLPAQYLREDFGFMHWSNFDEAIWKEVVDEAKAKSREQQCRIFASDADSRQLKVAKQNISNALMEDDIEVQLMDFMELQPVGTNGSVFMNPPYGERMEEENIFEFYKLIGNSLKRSWSGHRAWIISSDKEALKRVGLKPSRKFRLINGTLECGFYGFELFSGKRSEFLKS